MTDPAELADLHGRCFETPRPWTRAEFAELVQNPAIRVISRPGGFLLLRLSAPEAEILTLAVAPEMRRRGLARDLVRAALAQARLGGGTKVLLEVSAANIAALSLYSSLGFVQTGVRRGYYRLPDGSRQNAILLDKPL